MAEMGRAEAAALLGVPENADKAAVNAAARKLIAKYHPDAVRNKSAAEQAEAERMFKAVNKAKKVMLEPPKPAQPQGQPSHAQQSQRPSYGQQAQQSRQAQQVRTNVQTTMGRASSPSADRQRNKYNRATTFASDVPHVADNEESVLYAMYDQEARGRYRQGTDRFKLTWSIIPTIMMLVLSLYCLVTAFGANPALMDPAAQAAFMPYLVMAGICLVKLLVYDLLLSAIISSALKSRNLMSAVSLAGLELSVLAGVFMFVCKSVGNIFAVGALFLGLAVLGTGYIVSMARRRAEEAAYEDAMY